MKLDRAASPFVVLFVVGLVNIVLTAVAVVAHSVSDNLFLAVVTVQAGLAIAAAFLTPKCPIRPAALVIIVVALAIRAILLVQPPLLSDDVYRYIWDGRILNAGFNPYLHVPADPALTALRDGAIWPHVDKKDYAVTIYPPVAQLIFATVTRVSDGLTQMKLVMLGFEALAVAAMLSLLRQLGKGWHAIVLYLWHPFAPWEIANNAHIDAAMTGIAFAGLAFVGYKRPYRLVATLAASALVKPFAALFLPSAWRPFDLRLPLFVMAIAALLYAPFAWSAGSGVLGFLGQYFQEQGLDTGSGFFFVQLALRAGAPSWTNGVYIVSVAVLLLALTVTLAIRAQRNLGDRLVEAAIVSVTFLFLLTPVYPWYALLVAPFATLQRSWTVLAMTTTGFWLYSFLPDQIEFFARWSAAVAVVGIAGVADLWSLRRGLLAGSAT